ncbi:MAG: nucleoside-diphosphate kinase [Sedimentisphaerales bacterium]|nr:nucleoside-diphosphate kinase [Sedimentisphaerales bacterium]
MERTLIILKPDAVQRQLIGSIITRFEQKGLKIAACRFMRISRELAERHYAVHKGKPFYERLLRYITSGPVLVLVLQAAGVIAMSRKLMGATFGCDAEPGTIRGDFGGSKGFNLVHGSDSVESADYEIPLYFTENELVNYELANEHWLYGEEE